VITAVSGDSNVVDLYNGASGTWSTAQLSANLQGLAATSVGNVAIFAGGDIDYCFTLFVKGLLVWADSCGRWFDVCVFEAWGLLFCMRAGGCRLMGSRQDFLLPMLWTCTTVHRAHGRLRSSVRHAGILLRHLLGTWPYLRGVLEVIAV
jgi:hypothetical protein